MKIAIWVLSSALFLSVVFGVNQYSQCVVFREWIDPMNAHAVVHLNESPYRISMRPRLTSTGSIWVEIRDDDTHEIYGADSGKIDASGYGSDNWVPMTNYSKLRRQQSSSGK